MGVPTSDVDYTPAMPGEDHEVHKDIWWGEKTSGLYNKFSFLIYGIHIHTFPI